MKMLRQILQWIRRELFFDLNRVYKNDIRIPPRTDTQGVYKPRRTSAGIGTFSMGDLGTNGVIIQVRMIHWLVTRLKN